MGCRKKMWLCLLLWYALVYASEYAYGKEEPSKLSTLPSHGAADELSKADRESENNYVGLTASTGLPNGETGHFHNFSKTYKSPIVVADIKESNSSRIGYEKDLMLVMPVNANTNGSDLQMWYTQMPVTAIIEDPSTSQFEHRADYDTFEDSKQDDERHPYTNFLVNKPISKPKSPLDYGYPESFKFVEDLNGLPSNHKPEWASTDLDELEDTTLKTKATTESATSTRYNPFEMFESVKPLEINKLLSLQQPVPTSGSDLEETTTESRNVTESHIHTIPKRPYKRPTKKPQKIKLTTESSTSISSTFQSSTPSIEPIPSSMDSDQLYTAVRYTTLLSQSTKEFLPPSHATKIKLINMNNSFRQDASSTTTTTTETPYWYKIKTTTTTTPPPEIIHWQKVTTAAPSSTEMVHKYGTTRGPTTTTEAPTSSRSTYMSSIVHTMSKSHTKSVPSTTSTTTTTTTTTSTTVAPTTTTTSALLNSINDIAVYNVTEDVDEEDSPFVDQVDLNVPQNLSNFNLENFLPPKDINSFTLGSSSDGTETLKETNPTISGDMLTNDMKDMLVALGIIKSEQVSTTSTTEKVIVRKELVTPIIDSSSYTSFKKIPTDYKQQPDKSSISDDMKDLLASFGLLPKKVAQNETSGVRISRQQNLTDPSGLNFTEKINAETKPNVSLSPTSSITPDIEADVANFFKDDDSGGKPLAIDSDFLSSDEMKNTLENLGFLKQSTITNRSAKSGHVFQPTSHLEKLNKDDNAKKITDVIRTIKTLSIKTETNDISAEELEKQLLNLTATLENENFEDVNETLLFELNEFLTNDTNLKIIESIENMTSKMNPNKTISSTTETATMSSVESKKPSSQIQSTTESATVSIVESKRTSSRKPSTTESATVSIIEGKRTSSRTPSTTESTTVSTIESRRTSSRTPSTTESATVSTIESRRTSSRTPSTTESATVSTIESERTSSRIQSTTESATVSTIKSRRTSSKTPSTTESATVSTIESKRTSSRTRSTTESATVSTIESRRTSDRTTTTTESAPVSLTERKKPSSKTTTETAPSSTTTTTTEAAPSNLIYNLIPNTTQIQMDPPNPLSIDELLQLYEMGKNEIKRQQPNQTSSSNSLDFPSSTFSSSNDDLSIPGASTETFISNTDVLNMNPESTSVSTASITSSTSTEIATDTKVAENNNAPIADLADSFGGAEVANEEPSADDLPTPKPNGLYFYLDWNTFLNVGEEDKNPVRIRFAPRAGNPRNFLPITVP